jgi:hypothetical protein
MEAWAKTGEKYWANETTTTKLPTILTTSAPTSTNNCQTPCQGRQVVGNKITKEPAHCCTKS